MWLLRLLGNCKKCSEESCSASDEAKLFAKIFSRNSTLEDSGISLCAFSSRTNLKLHIISVTPKMVKKMITNLYLSKVSGPDCIPVVVLKNCEPELSYILAEVFSMCLKESCFTDCWLCFLYLRVFKAHFRIQGKHPTCSKRACYLDNTS